MLYYCTCSNVLKQEEVYSNVLSFKNGSRQWLFLAILFHISKRAWPGLVNNFIAFHMCDSQGITIFSCGTDYDIYTLL